MRICLVSTSDGGGGAAIATGRLHDGLLSAGLDSRWLVGSVTGERQRLIGPKTRWERLFNTCRVTLDRIPIWNRSRSVQRQFSIDWVPNRLGAYIGCLEPDIINLHWVGGGFLRPETLARINKPVVWTLHDMWAFTGGCHYSGGCAHYRGMCGYCPLLGSQREHDVSRWVYKRKARTYPMVNMTIVTPSKWLADCARKSSLLKGTRIEVIPNGVDVRRYSEEKQERARYLLHLPMRGRLILMGAVRVSGDRRKGIDILEKAANFLAENRRTEDVSIVIFGANEHDINLNFGMPVHCLGTLANDNAVALAYSAADVFVAPSREDNLPNTVLEAMSCGTPVVAFDIGGMSDIIDHQSNGYLATPMDVYDFTHGIMWVLDGKIPKKELRSKARKKIVENFNLERQVGAYRKLFSECLDANRSKLNR